MTVDNHQIIQDAVSVNRRLVANHIPNNYRLFFIAPHGSMNYGLWDSTVSDIDTYAVVIPSLKQSIIGNRYYCSKISTSNGICQIYDIRSMKDIWLKQGINHLEILFSIYNQYDYEYQQNYTNLKLMANDIANYDNFQLGMSAVGSGLNNLRQARNTHDNNKQIKHLIMALRMVEFINHKFIQQESFSDSIHSHLQSIIIPAKKDAEGVEAKLLLEMIPAIDEQLHKHKNMMLHLPSPRPKVCLDTADKLNNICYEIIKRDKV